MFFSLLSDYTVRSFFSVGTPVCVLCCTDTKRLALCSAGCVLLLAIKNCMSLWQHPTRLLQVKIPIRFEVIENVVEGDAWKRDEHQHHGHFVRVVPSPT